MVADQRLLSTIVSVSDMWSENLVCGERGFMIFGLLSGSQMCPRIELPDSFKKNTDACVPALEIVIKLVWGMAWALNCLTDSYLGSTGLA